MRSMTAFRPGAAFCLAWGIFCAGAHAGQGSLEISLVKNAGDNRYFEPAGRVIEMVSQPLRLLIKVKNVADTAAQARAEDETSYAFELTDESGAVTILKRKKKSGDGSGTQPFKYLDPGEAAMITIAIDRDTWENVPEFAYGKQQTFKVRVIYENYDGRKLYSPTYKLIIALGSLTR